MRIDSHHHFWNYTPEEYGWISDNMQVLKQDYLPADLAAASQPAAINGVVSVQARECVDETEMLLRFAEEHEWIRGVVGWVPLLSPELPDVLARYTGSRWLKSVRHVVQDEPDDEFLLRDDFSHGIARLLDTGLVYDILIYARQLPATIPFVDRHPDQVFVLDHIAKPAIRASEFDKEWETRIRELARRPNVFCKFSGVVTEIHDPDWNVESIRPYWDVVWEAFGAERMMFGSDWPVCLLRSGYQQWVSAVEQLAEDLSAAESTAFWSGNVCRAYRLDAQ